jgi:putative SOS response-associated peptidase YedK
MPRLLAPIHDFPPPIFHDASSRAWLAAAEYRRPAGWPQAECKKSA